MEVQPPPHVDHGGADLLFVLAQGRQTRGISGEQRAHHIQVAAFHRQLEILQGAGLYRHGMGGDADAAAEHAGGIAHAARLVHHIGGGRGLNDLMALQPAAGAAIGQQRAQMRVRHQRAIQRHHRAAVDRDGLAAIDRDQHILDTGIGMVFRRRHAVADGFLRQVQAGDGAGADAGAFAQGAAQDLQTALFGPADHTGDLGGADIQRRHQAGAIGGDFIIDAQTDRLAHGQVSFPLWTSFFSPPRRTKK